MYTVTVDLFPIWLIGAILTAPGFIYLSFQVGNREGRSDRGSGIIAALIVSLCWPWWFAYGIMRKLYK